jgi:hypothetical protein
LLKVVLVACDRKRKDILHCIEFLCENASPPAKEGPRGDAQRGEMDV